MIMKRKLGLLLAGVMLVGTALSGCSNGKETTETTGTPSAKGELEGEITFWHSFTQGARLETIQKVADQFLEDNPKVNIKIETFSWADFYTKWTTGLASGNVPDMSTALPSQVVEMLDADALIPLDDVIDDIGRNRFSEAALSEGEKDGE